jgi:hypothetical protein
VEIRNNKRDIHLQTETSRKRQQHCEKKSATVEFRRASKFLSIGCITTGFIFGTAATLLLEPFSEKLIAIDHHTGMTFRYTVGSLGGIGLIIGTMIGFVFNGMLYKFRGEATATADLNE